jgi:hypothetical protein
MRPELISSTNIYESTDRLKITNHSYLITSFSQPLHSYLYCAKTSVKIFISRKRAQKQFYSSFIPCNQSNKGDKIRLENISQFSVYLYDKYLPFTPFYENSLNVLLEYFTPLIHLTKKRQEIFFLETQRKIFQSIPRERTRLKETSFNHSLRIKNLYTVTDEIIPKKRLAFSPLQKVIFTKTSLRTLGLRLRVNFFLKQSNVKYFKIIGKYLRQTKTKNKKSCSTMTKIFDKLLENIFFASFSTESVKPLKLDTVIIRIDMLRKLMCDFVIFSKNIKKHTPNP